MIATAVSQISADVALWHKREVENFDEAEDGELNAMSFEKLSLKLFHHKLGRAVYIQEPTLP